MMLNPPIALFEEEDRQRFAPTNAAAANGNANSDYYPDFLRENQQMTDQVNQVIQESSHQH